MTSIYLDGHASTPLAPEAHAAMEPFWFEAAANPSSPHVAGARAADALEAGRGAVARLIGAVPSEIVFTSGATEANNIAVLGVARAAGVGQRRALVVGATEHKSILACAAAAQTEGFEVRIAPVRRDGMIDLEVLETLVDASVVLVSIGGANGEIGVLQPLSAIAPIVRRAGALFHSDLAQALGKVPIDAIAADLDYASLSSHKMYGPGGIGALYVAATAPRPAPLLFGGGQEGGLRPGSIPAPLAVGFGEAARIASREMAQDAAHAVRRVELFLAALGRLQVRYTINGDRLHRVPGSLSIQIFGANADSIVDRVSSVISISTGSACQAGQVEPSHVLKALGLSRDEQTATLRLFFGRYNRDEDVLIAADAIAAAAREEFLATGDLRQ